MLAVAVQMLGETDCSVESDRFFLLLPPNSFHIDFFDPMIIVEIMLKQISGKRQ